MTAICRGHRQDALLRLSPPRRNAAILPRREMGDDSAPPAADADKQLASAPRLRSGGGPGVRAT